MKFIRYGSLAPQSAVRWEIDRASMPVRRGIYAFPCGYLDYFYIWSGRGCDANPRVRYLKDESGRRLFYDELLDTPFQAGRTSIEYYNAYNELYDRIKAEEPDLTSIARNRKLHWRQFKPEWADYLKRKFFSSHNQNYFVTILKTQLIFKIIRKPYRMLHSCNLSIGE